MQANCLPMPGAAEISQQLRDQIVIDHLPLVKAIASRVHDGLPVHVEVDDLVHAGVLGLIDAVNKYDSAKNVAFQSYAKHRIKGAMLDSLRQLDWASRDLRKRQKMADATTQNLATKLGRVPEEGEIAAELGVTVDRWRKIASEINSTGPVAASGASDPDNDRPTEFAAAPDCRPDHMCERQHMKVAIARAMGTLPRRYQTVVTLYYSDEKTMKEIGEMLGVNESRVSQIHKTALRKMAVALESAGISSPAAL
jgi:RNA polymerase sigma factor FliA